MPRSQFHCSGFGVSACSVIQQHLHLPTMCLLSRCSPDWHSFRAGTGDYLRLSLSFKCQNHVSKFRSVSSATKKHIKVLFLRSSNQGISGSLASRWLFPDNFPWIHQLIVSALRTSLLLRLLTLCDCGATLLMPFSRFYCTGLWFSTTCTLTLAACQADAALNDMLYDEATRQSSPLQYQTAETSRWRWVGWRGGSGGCAEPIRALGFFYFFLWETLTLFFKLAALLKKKKKNPAEANPGSSAAFTPPSPFSSL